MWHPGWFASSSAALLELFKPCGVTRSHVSATPEREKKQLHWTTADLEPVKTCLATALNTVDLYHTVAAGACLA